jgi:hypothetical protein
LDPNNHQHDDEYEYKNKRPAKNKAREAREKRLMAKKKGDKVRVS